MMVNVDEDVVLEEHTDDEMRPLVDELKLQGQVANESFDNDISEKQLTTETTTYKEYFCDPSFVFYIENICDDSSTTEIDMSNKKLTSLPRGLKNNNKMMVNVDEDAVLEEQTDDEMRPLVDELKLQGQVANEPFDNDISKKQSTIESKLFLFLFKLLLIRK
ncbi:hypothetical protein HCN44_006897 [Aphidius gifuensis]|uniref:Uncharacterized protein n=1 Tax=Aphidius gifuensis TaxID=684658 RepID=A0A834XYB7_APHGI|nr:hypothetical protein HCN44_006897 [Aphidius gifuensis]